MQNIFQSVQSVLNLAVTYSYEVEPGANIDTVPLVLSVVIGLLFGLFYVVCMWMIFDKAGEEGWKALVPFYNTYTMMKLVGMNPWLFLLMFVPLVSAVVAIIMLVKLGGVFGRSLAFSVFALVLFPFVGLPILAFGSAEYSPSRAA